MNSQKVAAGVILPEFSAVSVETGAPVNIGAASGKWQLIVVYRGKHCGRCKKYLNTLQSMQTAWNDAGFDIMTVSADSREKAQLDVAEFGWTFPISCELSETEMRKLGLYISEPLSANEADGRFSEPGVFCLRPDGTVQIVALSNGPAARPDLAELLDGMIFTINNERPARGTVA
ncbi:redoxin domain-containing protein [Marinomonas sp. 15G1-11]|uniref:Redoxin domain-containing protein n=1 Tax=Marinomonas phaeophyticola TaxID=3004091 RepID=A0ABT4JTN4_9GAMM|nr:redoxin domain-containing protein [Marinomonas sp. 15G1-11]MCZ2720959.1 redoxin domain-containing protein [Marinomonas sp. 15G1-11]